jgi:hypothetical protein
MIHPDEPQPIDRIRFEHRFSRRIRRLIGRSSTHVAAAVAALLIVGGGGYALASSRTSKPIHACVNKRSGVVSVRAHCARNSRALTWNRQGPRGKAGTTTTITRMAPSGWTVDFLDESGLSATRTSDDNLSSDSHGVAAVRRISMGDYRVVVTGCHNHAPTVLSQADPAASDGGYVPQADALVPVSNGYQPVSDARPNSSGDETFDVFTFRPSPSAPAVAGGYINDADPTESDFTFLIYC